ncbi:NADH-quinone oxidoreductase subunit B [Elizabethkingia anophelis]
MSKEVKILETPPPGHAGEGFFATKLDSLIGTGQSKFSLPLPFATSCCGIEFMAMMNPTYDLARFGGERMVFSPRQADILLVCGTISKKLAPILKTVYSQMAEPRWVVAVGACASSGGIFDTYSVLQGIDKVIPVDVYVPGCPPRPEQILEGFMQVQAIAKSESLRRRDLPEYKELLESYNIK